MFIFVRWGGGGGRAGRRSEERVGDNLIGHHLLALEPVPPAVASAGFVGEGWPGTEQAVEVCFLFGAGPRRGYRRAPLHSLCSRTAYM